MILILMLAVAAQVAPALVLPPHSVPPAAMRPPALLRGPQGHGSVQSYITPFDYPAAAHGAFGTVGLTLTVGSDGHVIGCTIKRTSGSAALDAATCQLVQRRARYNPAIDADGTPVIGTVDEEVVWKAP